MRDQRRANLIEAGMCMNPKCRNIHLLLARDGEVLAECSISPKGVIQLIDRLRDVAYEAATMLDDDAPLRSDDA